ETLHLHGPLPQWSDDAIAFMTLWQCLPRVAWLRPAEDPYGPAALEETMRRWGFASGGNDDAEADFGTCVRRVNNRPSWNTVAERDALAALADQMAERATP